ncbi:phosphodiester glycosidase family protein [Rhizobium ipomoeae]|nr:phosphodiester glycosidase family protein [Rhizobium sp. 'Codium 1']MCC8933412.1 phosphodiester glycosidase family protein [Rhizobium sp. 'Codium 1']
MRHFLTILGFMAATFSLPTLAHAACEQMREGSTSYLACRFDPGRYDIRTHLAPPDGQDYGGFASLRRQLWAERRVLLFAMNAGMYHDDLSPVGYFAEYGTVSKPAVTTGGWGNFHLLPNGVFLMTQGKAEVMETKAFVARGVAPDFGTQSGPMLVIDGKLHPRFLPDSDSYKIRNGVGVDAEGHVHMVVSRVPVRFYDFAVFFRDRLGCDNALYLDGTISSVFSAEDKRMDRLFPMGPILSVSMPIPQ